MVARMWVRALWCVCATVTLVDALCPPCQPPCKATGSATADECFYHIDNIVDDFSYNTASSYFGLECVEGLTLEELSLPRFPSPVWVPRVALAGCPCPEGVGGGGGGWGAALARLNVLVPEKLLLLRLPAHPPLRKHHFAGMQALRYLHIAAERSITVNETEADIFNPLTNIVNLKLQGVRLPTAALTNISAQNLSSLDLVYCGLREIPSALCRLPQLSRLQVIDNDLQAFPSACNFTTLVLITPNLQHLPALHSVVELTLTMKEAVKLEHCESLKKLTVNFTEVSSLPDDWLAQCPQLAELRLKLPNVTVLTNRAFAGATALRILSIESNNHIRELKPGLFLHTRNIETLILSRNNLTQFPSDLFAPLSRLHTLDLSHNRLTPPALEPLSGLPLRRLLLNHNPLSDLCPPQGRIVISKQRSNLQSLNELEELGLQHTGAARICSDWRDLARLRTLDLRNNNITDLWGEDMSWRQRDHLTEVRLAYNPIKAIIFDQSEYKTASRRDNVKIRFILYNSDNDRPLRCDCNFYWFTKALREGKAGVQFEDFPCTARGVGMETDEDEDPYKSSVHFSRIKLKDMVCPIPDVKCPVNCTCVLSPEAGGALVECWRREALPPLEGVAAGLKPGVQLAVRAAGTGLYALPAALPSTLASLDLSRNQLRALPPAPARALFAAARRLRLQGNPLLCACDQPLIKHIQHHPHQVVDLENVTCADGRSVVAVINEECDAAGAVGVEAWAWALGGCGLALAAGGAALWALWALRPASRLRLKAFLLARGICLRWARPHDDGFKYDAFLSYAHADSAVAAELLATLEASGLRLCVHHRDWRPGAWIPAQIIESVAESRRTVVLLSEAFVRSGWARAEFREAYARALQDDGGSARLVVVVLGEAPPAGLDPEMRHYVTHNTYVRWGEPAFWNKLRAALPPAPRALPAPRPRKRRHPTPAPTPTPQEPAPHPPPTPIVKFAEMDFPTPQKPFRQETSPCA